MAPTPLTVPQVMGVLNVTPDSFSDGGQFVDPDAATRRGLEIFSEGAGVVDVGGESTRPGAEPVVPAEEIRRVVPVIEALAPHGTVSVDTRHRQVAEAAVEAGATIINDVSASLHEVAAEAGVGWIAMHMQGDPRTMQSQPTYGDVVTEVSSFLAERAEAAVAAGVPQVWIDPGIGFGKTVEHNLSLLRHLSELVALGHPVVVGTSRKAFLGRLLGESDGSGQPTPPGDRLEGSLASAVWSFRSGAAMVRAHDVAATVAAMKIVIEEVAA